MARLRGRGRYALLESALTMPRQAEWSYIAGPSLATLHTDETATRLGRDGRECASWSDPLEALASVTGTRTLHFDGERPPGMGFVGGWVGMLGYELLHTPSRAAGEPVLPRQWWMAVDQVLAFHHPSGRWWQSTVVGPEDGWPWSEPITARMRLQLPRGCIVDRSADARRRRVARGRASQSHP